MPAPDPPVPELSETPPAIDGLVQRHDADGRLVEEARFRVGRLHGPFRLFHRNGGLRREAGYVDGHADGLATDYDDAGRTLAETSWRAGQRDGEARLYADGRLALVMQWQGGKLDGPLCVYGAGGELTAVMPHREGRLHGAIRIYGPNGRLMLEAEHFNGKRHGPSVQFDADGQAVERVDYVEGSPQGVERPAQDNMPDEAAADPLRAFYAGLAREGSAEPG